MIRYSCSFIDKHCQQMQAEDGRESDLYQYTFKFRLVLESKVDQPDEFQSVEKRRITVSFRWACVAAILGHGAARRIAGPSGVLSAGTQRAV
jgi:hypothetical protein